MRKELGENLTGGITIKSAVSELMQIKAIWNDIYKDFSTEVDKQTASIKSFYDEKIKRMMDIDPWDKALETIADYKSRVEEARRNIASVQNEKDQKLFALRSELATAHNTQIRLFEKQMMPLEEKRFPVPAPQVTFKFSSYHLPSQKMRGELKIDGKNHYFAAAIPKLKACKYEKRPELLVPEVKLKATWNGSEIDKIIFHGPNQNEIYTAKPCNLLGMEFVHIKPGTFMMGSPSNELRRDSDERQHRVTLTKGFYMQTREVTQGEWKEVMGPNFSYFSNGGDNCPVENVSWDNVQGFIQELNQRAGGKKYRLPTEAEWEYACRAGSATTYCFGSDKSGLGEYAWYNNNSCEKTQPVGQKKPNAWGLYDMHGNIYEWCKDWKGEYPTYPVIDPTGPARGSFRVLRGGSWYCKAAPCRSANRCNGSPGRGYRHLGFRLLRME